MRYTVNSIKSDFVPLAFFAVKSFFDRKVREGRKEKNVRLRAVSSIEKQA